MVGILLYTSAPDAEGTLGGLVNFPQASDLGQASELEQLELRQAPEQRLRQRDFARSIVLTRSGISRLIDRLEAAGLVRREPNPKDRRGDLVVLTSEGSDALRRTWPEYARGIAEHFARDVEADEARTLSDVLERVRAEARKP